MALGTSDFVHASRVWRNETALPSLAWDNQSDVEHLFATFSPLYGVWGVMEHAKIRDQITCSRSKSNIGKGIMKRNPKTVKVSERENQRSMRKPKEM
jgi:hypothetical protein